MPADEAYACKNNLLTSWSGKNLSTDKYFFNFWICSALLTIEEVFLYDSRKMGYNVESITEETVKEQASCAFLCEAAKFHFFRDAIFKHTGNCEG